MCGRFALGAHGDELADLLASQNLRRNRRREHSQDVNEDAEDHENPSGEHDRAGSGNEEEEQDDEMEVPTVHWASEAEQSVYRKRYNIAPQTRSPVLRHSTDTDKADYTLSFLRWGLIPSWTKRAPDYASSLKTINSRDDTLFSGSGMWAGIRNKKRCVVIASGFYEWLSKKGAKQKQPHYTKMGDGTLMAMAGLWDSVTYVGETEAIETFTIITTSSAPSLSFLHDRMPALLTTPEDIATWLSPEHDSWSPKLQSLIKPFRGSLECYPVPTEVGKVGNESPDFILPVKERKGGLESMFKKQVERASPKKDSPTPPVEQKPAKRTRSQVKRERDSSVEVVDLKEGTVEKKVKLQNSA